MASRSIVASLIVAAAVAGAAPLAGQRADRIERADARRFYADDPLWIDDDRRDTPPVAKQDLSATYDLVENTFGTPAKSRGPAMNTNTLGEVPDSSWFTNRLGTRDMTIDEVLTGPSTIEGPAPGTWTVIGRPGSGITPKFTIRDANGVTFVIKLDPPDAQELASSVELIGTKIFHAIGYNVPEDFIASLDPEKLVIAPGTKFKSKWGDKRPLTMEQVQRWLAQQPRQADGTIRVLASRWVPGQVVGQFRYAGTRPDDPNDIYPHERRRELRGLKVFAAWLNHDDARALNTIDVYVNERGRRYIRHYLQDFGSILGSGSTDAQSPRAGNEYYIEGKAIGKGLAGLGIAQRDWMKVQYPDMPSVGNLEADFFEPARWKTEYPHPAFDQMDAADAFWAARIASRFTDEMITRIVESARLSDPRARDYLTGAIIKRRNKVVAHWIGGTNPLDAFRATTSGGDVTLTFDNAATRLGLAADTAEYRVQFAALDNMSGAERSGGSAVTGLRELTVPAETWGPRDLSGFRYVIVSIRTLHEGYPHWAEPIRVTLRERGGDVTVVGVNRPSGRRAAAKASTS
ncbi:MAG TPA: hypothetical protein VFP85_20380 [Vicinamibacterales bacterium]|nr:hypothetical protein [Vicinamibacterales bacterium]